MTQALRSQCAGESSALEVGTDDYVLAAVAIQIQPNSK